MDLWNLFFRVTGALAEEGAAVDPAATADAAAQMTGAESVISLLGSFVPMIAIVAVFYFMMIRPQRKKDKKVKEMLNNLKVGDRVTTIGGIHGTIMGIKDETITLGVGAEKTKLVFARWAIRTVDEVSIENDSETLV